MGTQIGQFVLFAVYYHTDGYYNHNKAKQMYEHILFDVHVDVIKPRHYPPYRPFARGIHRLIPRTKANVVELWCFLWSTPE